MSVAKGEPRAARHWLFKSEPESFSFADLLAAPRRRTRWDGVRNYQARNLIRDEMAVGDDVLFYHSSTDPMAIAGLCRIVRAAYPDPSAFDTASAYHDPKSDPDAPAWFAVDIEAVRAFVPPLTRERLKAERGLSRMVLLQRGSRLSVQPVTDREFEIIVALAGGP